MITPMIGMLEFLLMRYIAPTGAVSASTSLLPLPAPWVKMATPRRSQTAHFRDVTQMDAVTSLDHALVLKALQIFKPFATLCASKRRTLLHHHRLLNPRPGQRKVPLLRQLRNPHLCQLQNPRPRRLCPRKSPRQRQLPNLPRNLLWLILLSHRPLLLPHLAPGTLLSLPQCQPSLPQLVPLKPRQL